MRLQSRSISPLSSGLCLPPLVAIESASLAAGYLNHRRSAAKTVARSRLVRLISICVRNPFDALSLSGNSGLSRNCNIVAFAKTVRSPHETLIQVNMYVFLDQNPSDNST